MKIQISPLDAAETQTIKYDATLATVGYESRSRYFFEKNSIQTGIASACIFSQQQVLDYKVNEQFFKDKGFTSISASVDAIKTWAKSIVSTGPSPGNESIFVLVDISSMTRQFIAAVVYFLRESAHNFNFVLDVHFVYSIAEFGAIPKSYGPIVSNGPSIKEMAGWSEKPKLPCAIVLGIGYEEDLALGIIEDLEAARVWVFRPCDHDHRYDEAIDERNRGLFEEIPVKQLIRYSVYEPYSLFVKLEALIGLSKKESRVIIVPFGPKIFTLAGSLATIFHYPKIGLWRVSGGENQEPVDRKAAGPIPSLAARYIP